MVKIDVCLWTKNGSLTLPQVLKRIDNVIPASVVNRRFIVDDFSLDDTKEIASKFGYDIIKNCGVGVSDAANTALNNVETELFIGVEQDVLLASDFFPKIYGLMKRSNASIVSGVRVASHPLVGAADFYALSHDCFCGHSIDNTLYVKHDLVSVGGFPKVNQKACSDSVLALKLDKCGLKWSVARDVVSIHLRDSVFQELKHQYWYGHSSRFLGEFSGDRRYGFFSDFMRLVASPVRGFQIAFQSGNGLAVLYYPLLRFVSFLGRFS